MSKSNGAKNRAKDSGSGAAQAARDAAEGLRNGAQAAARDGVSSALDGAADRASDAARAADDASTAFDPSAFPARALESVSLLLEDTARGLRDADLDSVLADVQTQARRHPLIFIAGAAAVGFAAARIARAAGTPDDDAAETEDRGDG